MDEYAVGILSCPSSYPQSSNSHPVPPFPELTVTTFDLAPQITHDSHEAMKGWDHNKSTGSAADSRILFLFTLFPSRNEPFNVDTVGVKAIL